MQDRIKGASYFRKSCDVDNLFRCDQFVAFMEEVVINQERKEYYKACDLGKTCLGVRIFPEQKNSGKKLVICMTY